MAAGLYDAMPFIQERVPTAVVSVSNVATIDFQPVAGDEYYERYFALDMTEDTTLNFVNQVSGNRFSLSIQNASGVARNLIFPGGLGQGSLQTLTNSIADGETYEATGYYIFGKWLFTLEPQVTLV